jgi:hypothetical protein
MVPDLQTKKLKDHPSSRLWDLRKTPCVFQALWKDESDLVDQPSMGPADSTAGPI